MHNPNAKKWLENVNVFVFPQIYSARKGLINILRLGGGHDAEN